MAVPLVVNGVTFQYPAQFDKNWGPTLTNWSSAVTTGMLQTSGVNAATFVKSATLNPASSGFLRLAKTDALSWRNNLNSGDLALTINGSNQLTFNGVAIGTAAALTDSHIFVGNASNQPADVAVSGVLAITNAGVTSFAAGAIVNADVNNSAAIAFSKLAATTAYYWYAANGSGVLTPLAVTASKAVVTDSNGLPAASATTATELGYVSGVTSAIQTQINAINSVPAGAMLDFAGTVAPSGWLLCDGSSYATASYPGLFAAIGYAWGGAGANFNVPNMTRRVAMGSGGSGTSVIGNSVGNVGGAETDSTTTHTHTEHAHTHDMTHRHLTNTGNTGGGTVYKSVNWSEGTSNINDQFWQWAGAGAGPSTLAYQKTAVNDTANTGSQSDTGMSSNAANTSTVQPAAIVLKIIKY